MTVWSGERTIEDACCEKSLIGAKVNCVCVVGPRLRSHCSHGQILSFRLRSLCFDSPSSGTVSTKLDISPLLIGDNSRMQSRHADILDSARLKLCHSIFVTFEVLPFELNSFCKLALAVAGETENVVPIRTPAEEFESARIRV